MRTYSKLLYQICVAWVVVMCSNSIFAEQPLGFSEKLNMGQVEQFYKEVDKETSVFEVNYSPSGMGVQITSEINGEKLNEFLVVNGKFDVGQSVISNHIAVSGGRISKKIQIDRRWQGSDSYRRLEPLLLVASNVDTNETFFLACGKGEDKEILDLSFYGPFLISDRKNVREMISAAVDAKSGSLHTELDPRRYLLDSDGRWTALLGLVILKQRGEITASDFVLNPKLCSIDDVTILNDLFYQATLSHVVDQSLVSALLVLVREKDTQVARKAMAHIAKLAEKNIYNTGKQLRGKLSAFEDLKHEAISRKQVSPELEEDIRKLKNMLEERK